jgi:hypothetical protein
VAPGLGGATRKKRSDAKADQSAGLVHFARRVPAAHREQAGLYLRYGPRQDGWGHMSAAGNAFIAQQIAQRLATRGWLPPLIQDASVKDAGSGGGPLDRHER